MRPINHHRYHIFDILFSGIIVISNVIGIRSIAVILIVIRSNNMISSVINILPILIITIVVTSSASPSSVSGDAGMHHHPKSLLFASSSLLPQWI